MAATGAETEPESHNIVLARCSIQMDTHDMIIAYKHNRIGYRTEYSMTGTLPSIETEPVAHNAVFA